MNTNKILMMEGASYEAPAISVFILENEGAVCAASNEAFDDETGADEIFGWK